MKLTEKQLTVAIGRYARKYGYSISTVHTISALRFEAIKEYQSILNSMEKAINQLVAK